MLMVDGSKEFYKLPSKCQSFVTMLVLSCAEFEFGSLTKYVFKLWIKNEEQRSSAAVKIEKLPKNICKMEKISDQQGVGANFKVRRGADVSTFCGFNRKRYIAPAQLSTLLLLLLFKTGTAIS